MATTATSRRDDRMDFLRGIALLVIFVDHVPKNLFEPFTLHAFSFSDAAEVFFFISGYVAALVYGRVMERSGFVAAARKVWRRAGVVYGAQMLLLAAVLLLVWVFLVGTGDQTYRWMFRVQWVYENPLSYVAPALTLHYQPGYLDILPTYVLLLAVFPLVLWGLQKNLWLVVVPSFALWLFVQLTGFTLWTTANERWFFNPFAWQALFVAGAVFGHPSTRGRMGFLDSRWLFRIATAIVLPVAAMQLSVSLHKVLPFVPSLLPGGLPLDKTVLQPLRLASFAALAVVVRHYLPPIGTLSRHAALLAVVRCGRASLNVFALGVFLASLTAVTWVLGGNEMLQSALCVVGIGAQLIYAAWRENRRTALAPSVGEPMPVRADLRR